MMSKMGYDVVNMKGAHTLTLVIETVYPVDGGTLVVPSQQEKVLWVFNLVCQQQADGLQRLLPSVHIISQKQIVTLRGVSTILKQPEQVVVLTVNITYKQDSRTERQGCFIQEKRNGLRSKSVNFIK